MKSKPFPANKSIKHLDLQCNILMSIVELICITPMLLKVWSNDNSKLDASTRCAFVWKDHLGLDRTE